MKFIRTIMVSLRARIITKVFLESDDKARLVRWMSLKEKMCKYLNVCKLGMPTISVLVQAWSERSLNLQSQSI